MRNWPLSVNLRESNRLSVAYATCFATVRGKNKAINAMGEKKEVMIMMKKFLALLLSVCLLAALCAGCGSTQTTAEDPATDETTTAGTEDPVTIRLGGLKGPTSMGMVKLLSDNDGGTTTNHYAFTMAGSAD